MGEARQVVEAEVVVGAVVEGCNLFICFELVDTLTPQQHHLLLNPTLRPHCYHALT